MSATCRGSKRHEADFYATPESAFKPLLPFVKAIGQAVWEPASGDGRLISWMRESGLLAFGDDLVRGGYDFLKSDVEHECILTNPPFSLALEFCDHAIKHSPNVFMLLRLNFLASKKRRDWWNAHKPDALFVLSERPSFAMFVKCSNRTACNWRKSFPPKSERIKSCPRCDGKVNITTSDATDYAWFYWGKIHKGFYFL